MAGSQSKGMARIAKAIKAIGSIAKPSAKVMQGNQQHYKPQRDGHFYNIGSHFQKAMALLPKVMGPNPGNGSQLKKRPRFFSPDRPP
jgi:hypothetical protein